MITLHNRTLTNTKLQPNRIPLPQHKNECQIQRQPAPQHHKYNQATNGNHVLHVCKHNKINQNKSIYSRRKYKHFITLRLSSSKIIWSILIFSILIKDVYRNFKFQCQIKYIKIYNVKNYTQNTPNEKHQPMYRSSSRSNCECTIKIYE